MRAAEAMRDATERLAAVSDTARLDAELLMAHALGVTRSDLLLRHGDAPVPQDRFEALLIRRLAHEPIAYILGSQAFLGLDLMVNTDVLIPRGDSESVVETALEAMPGPERVLDCGTGSGALLLAVLSQRPAASGIGIDRSLGALALAAANAAKLGLADRAHMLHADWHEPGWADGLGLFDLIIANPPYVESGAVLDPSVARYEPAEALYAGADGLDDYRVLVPQLPELLAPGGKVVLEIGATQADAVAALGQAAGFESDVRHDLAGRPRAVILSRC
ncbi:MAG: peptide chain release factor N(5)-glutamine methyltransferase [Novosphingobium sp.]|nr:peptide chain release factor N(5)-glutamine methyltransferase [Novosphingobium sp.]